MAPIIPTEVPSVISAGETVKFTRSFQGFDPGDGWKYSFHMNGPSNVLHKDADTDSDPFAITLTSTDTAFTVTDPKGTVFRYEEWIANADGTENYQVGSGAITVLLNLRTAAPGATQSQASKDLAAVTALIEGRLTDDIQSYQIAGRAIVKLDFAKLLDMQGKLRARVAAEQNSGTSIGETVKVVFSDEPNGTQSLPPTWVDVTGLDQP